MKQQIMKNLTKFLLIVLWAISFQPMFGQIEKEQVVGSWLGTMDLGNISMRLVFIIRRLSAFNF